MATRKEIVSKIAQLLQEYCDAKALGIRVIDHMPSSFDGASPVIAIFGDGSMRRGLTSKNPEVIHRVIIYTAAVYGRIDVAEINERAAQNTLNDLQQMIDIFVTTFKRVDGFWFAIDFEELFSNVTPVRMGAVPYFVETHALLVRTAPTMEE